MSILGLLFAASFTALVQAAGQEDVFEWQPEIHHVFREAEKMPPATFSMIFALVTLSPWIFLLIGWLRLGYTPANVISELTQGSKTRSIYIAAFLGSLVSLEYLFYLYWTKLDLFQTLTYFGGLALVAFFTGQRALSSVQNKRLHQ
ncbi:Dolichyl-diphosphooligosaccharide--protein glycosyltransferase subunit Swp1 [Gilbertella persicaria]|uniref:Dolichyl-diphosphooligosaccharide--protein glycosyltransferase subunit Swp1 n=1 Tax=Gilbertella persicaria TaxID=101096 RepID=UPI00222032B5|nr:Dolichyl-diphosphooligosaccharide--protein glycosyltransferase subunit Swp1 [Gilbertella persicaria]KAI8082513.1 Dolichyl-diphosphooligosaccharide--protein glycosyltransferase subunit Swp1 [Gilbertella persicaria]